MANDVYFVGSLDGTIQAYHTKNGKKLWSTQNPSPVTATPQIAGSTLYIGGSVPNIFAKWADAKEHGLYAYSVK